MKSFYLASPLGFAASTIPYMNDLAERLRKHVDIHNPWDETPVTHQLSAALSLRDVAQREQRLAALNHQLGKLNREAIDAADGMIAVLDGVDVDSGTAAEIGYAYAHDKLVLGLRTDFRLAGDNPGSIVNLQVEYFITESGGEIALSTDRLIRLIKEIAEFAATREVSDASSS